MKPTRFRLLLLAVALPLAAAAADDVIYPRGSPAATPAAAEERPARLNLAAGLLGLACAGAAGWLYWRNRRPGAAGRSERKLAIAETRSLGNRQHLVVAEYEGRKFLLGVCPGRIDLLTSLDRPARDPQP
ncbi:MAG: flagellar biosynthetic protein FliO [Opitutaceae bacterium]|nr:flagellar biosynthetic protein FliO [Opitutaceae bacterium]